MKTALAAISAFAVTNTDDIFILMLLFSQCYTIKQQYSVVLGQYLGIGTLTVISVLSALFFKTIPTNYIGIIGFVPVFLGIRQLIANRNTKDYEDNNARLPRHTNIIFNTLLITVSNGADNLGVYIPMFTVFSSSQLMLTIFVFMAMTALWCILAKKISDLSVLNKFLKQHSKTITPAVFILIGVYIIAETFIL